MTILRGRAFAPEGELHPSFSRSLGCGSRRTRVDRPIWGEAYLTCRWGSGLARGHDQQPLDGLLQLEPQVNGRDPARLEPRGRPDSAHVALRVAIAAVRVDLEALRRRAVVRALECEHQVPTRA